MGPGGIYAARHLKPFGAISRKILIHSETLRSSTRNRGSNREMIDSERVKNITGRTRPKGFAWLWSQICKRIGDPLNLRSVFLVTRSRDRMVSANKATSYSRPPTTWRTTLAKAASM
ncbi:hypothetical protein CRG98_012074 [Punica granatum]|uniref:Uncharacterized protein n=1 Tax=Punica granatum TaxID=22663 RepID=A0A2I0KGN8_PUNGR|nr:hypothetical protein CRG98_012074 [Punica granatum]